MTDVGIFAGRHHAGNKRVGVELLEEGLGWVGALLRVEQLGDGLGQGCGTDAEDAGDPFIDGGADDGQEQVDEDYADGPVEDG